MAFKKKVDFLQRERDELPHVRPVIIFITAPPDSNSRTTQYKHFTTDSNLPAGVLKREANPIHFCLIEASSSLEAFSVQVTAALDEYKDAAHKEIILNAHAIPEGILLNKGEEETVVLTGSHFADVVLSHTHGHFLQVFAFTAHGHTFAKGFYDAVKKSPNQELSSTVAITYFTSTASPNAWDKIATSGSGHVEVKRDLKDYIKTNIGPNTPYKMIDTQVAKTGCVIL